MADAERKFPNNVKVCTVHSLAYQWYKKQHPRHLEIVNGYKIFDLEPVFAHLEPQEAAAVLQSFNNYCNSALTDCPDSRTAAFFDAVEKGLIPPSHSFYLKLYQLKAKRRFDQFDYLLMDEAQDTNAVTMSIFMAEPARRILVGDSHQSIYMWRGAVNALERFETEARLIQHLSCSFRCSAEVTKRANFCLQRYAADRNTLVPMKSMAPKCRGNGRTCAYISRTNGKLICLMDEKLESVSTGQLKKYGLTRPAAAIFAAPTTFYKFICGERKFKGEFAWLNKFKTTGELTDYAEQCADPEVQSALNCAKRYAGRLYYLYDKARLMEKSSDPKYIFTTAHSAKGMEWDRVELQDDFPDLEQCFKNSRLSVEALSALRKAGHEVRALSPEEFEQELNLLYVAITRARLKLTDHSANQEIYENRG